MKANFLDLHAAADFLGPGAIEIERYQTEITDIVRRRGVFGQRMKQVPATGPSIAVFRGNGDRLRRPRRRRSSIRATSCRRCKRRHEWSAAFR